MSNGIMEHGIMGSWYYRYWLMVSWMSPKRYSSARLLQKDGLQLCRWMERAICGSVDPANGRRRTASVAIPNSVRCVRTARCELCDQPDGRSPIRASQRGRGRSFGARPLQRPFGASADWIESATWAPRAFGKIGTITERNNGTEQQRNGRICRVPRSGPC
eukprot:1035641-Prorocentrum_minimum.AAC.3